MAASATKPRRTTPTRARKLQVVPGDDRTDGTAGGEQAHPPRDQTPYLAHLDPRELLNHPSNVRRDLGDLSELRASITAQGVLQALTVVPTDDGGHRVVFGHRRAAASAEALDTGEWPAGLPETVPCVVRPDLVGLTAEQIVGMITENDQRAGITHSERAAGYAQLSLDFGMDEAEIARRTGRPLPHVRSTLKLHSLGETVTAAADKGTVTLDDIADLEEFDDKTVARILKDADTSWGIKHRIKEERRKRDDKAAADRLTTELAETGVLVVSKPKGWPYECPEAKVADLRTADGVPVDPDEVKTEEGFAAIIEGGYGNVTATLICLDPDAHGYQRTSYSTYKSPRQLADEETARQAAEEREAQLGEAQDTRERFLVERYGTAKTAKTLLVDALRATVTDPEWVDGGDAELIQALAGGDIYDTAGAGPDRLNRLLVAMWVAAEETNLVNLSLRAWQSDGRRRAVAWLDRLVAAGYELSAAESTLRDDLASNPDDEDGSDRDDEQADTEATTPPADAEALDRAGEPDSVGDAAESAEVSDPTT